MDSNLVEWTETVNPEVKQFLNKLYNNYTEIETGKPIDKPDFNGVILMLAVYDSYIKEMEGNNITETKNLTLKEAYTKYLEYSKKIHFTEILY